MTYLLGKKGKTLKAATVAGWICVALILFFDVTLYAQVEPFSVSSPPNPVGSGARAMGMGGAFVAVADDATAASWNPAGLIHLQKPEVSAVFSLERRANRRYSQDFPELDGEERKTISDLNYLSMAYPFNLARRNWVFSLNYQRLYDFNRELRFSYQGATVEFNSKGALYTLSPALAIQTTENLFFGLTLNIWSDEWTGRSGWKNTLNFIDTINPGFPIHMIKEEYKDFRGLNANLGLIYRITPQWTLGVVLKIPFRGRFNYIYHDNFDPNADSGMYYRKLEFLDLPPTYALGISYRISDALTISADVTRKDWDELAWNNKEGQSYSLFTKFDIDPNNQKIYPLACSEIDPTYAFRIGIEYLKILEKTVIPFRGGIFYDPIPSVGSPHSEYGISVGSGISLGDLIIDFAYQYRVRYDVPGTETGWGSEYYGIFEDKRQHIFLLSGIYHF